jgi:hypothetical protein
VKLLVIMSICWLFFWKVGRVKNGVRVAKLLSLICLVCSRDGGQRLGQVQLDDSKVAYFLIASCLFTALV